MAKGDTAAQDPAAEIDAILKDGKKKPMNFALLKTKEGVVIKAHPLKSPEAMFRAAKEAGGMPVVSCTGVLNVTGKVMQMTSLSDDVPRNLPKMAKKYFASLGLPFKVIITLPGGGTLDDADEDEGEAVATDTVAPGIEVPVEEEPPVDDTEKTALQERLDALRAQAEEAVRAGLDGAGDLLAGLDVAATALADGVLENVAANLDDIEKKLEGLRPADALPDVDLGALKAQLQAEFDALAEQLAMVTSKGSKAIAGKAEQIAAMFRAEIERDLKKAGAVLNLLRTFLKTEGGKLQAVVGDTVETAKGFLGGIAETVGNVADVVGGVVRDVVGNVVEDAQEKAGEIAGKIGAGVAAVGEAIGGAVEDVADRMALTGLGLPADVAAEVVAAKDGNPDAVAEAKARFAETEAAGLPLRERGGLIRLALTDPKAYAAAVETFKTMDPEGKVDISPEAMAQSLRDIEALRQRLETESKAADAAWTAFEAARTAKETALGAIPGAQGDLAQAMKDAADYEAGLGNIDEMDSDAHAAVEAEIARLTAEVEDKRMALATAEQEAAEAEAAETAADADLKVKDDAAAAVGTQLTGAEETRKAQEDKKGLLDAVSFGPLAPGATPALTDGDRAALIGAYGKDPALGRTAMDVAKNAAHPTSVAQNAGAMADKVKGGFADKDGNTLPMSQEQLRAMAGNALSLGGRMGDDYFAGFDEYLKSGKQLAPDPYGALEDPLPTGETGDERISKIALNRSSGMGAAALGPDGKVDFTSPEAVAAMDDMMFHPGALTEFTPHMTEKMQEMKGLFADPVKGPQAQGVIDATSLPAAGDAGQATAADIVGGTTGKDPATVTDEDAKTSVLSAMMTPMSQGPVGSCFTTAPVRAIRETDPVRAMGEFSKIASTGQYTGTDGVTYPANNNPPVGENPLMRSWEYSVATSAANLRNSAEKANLSDSLFGGNGPGKDLGGIKDIVGEDVWNNTNDPVTGDIIPGLQAKLRKAIKAELTYEYDAGPPKPGAGGGGGDGHSTDGAYRMFFKGAAVPDDAAFVAAVQDIALRTAGETAGTPNGDAIIALISDPDFIESFKSLTTDDEGNPDYNPYDLGGGGFESQTMKVLDGGSPANHVVLDPRAEGLLEAITGKSPGARTVDVLKAVLSVQAGVPGADMVPMGTTGDDANHAFNTLPKHPSMAKLQPPDQDAKIDAELVQPGKKIAAKELPLDQCVKLYEDQLRSISSQWADGGAKDELAAALDCRPTVPMTPGDLDKLVKVETKAFKDATVDIRLEQWREEQVDAGTPPTPEALAEHKAGLAADVDGWVAEEMDIRLANAIPLPEVVIADANWGDPGSQTLFVVAPDPRTGELRLYEKDSFTGKLEPAGENWSDAMWDTVK